MPINCLGETHQWTAPHPQPLCIPVREICSALNEMMLVVVVVKINIYLVRAWRSGGTDLNCIMLRAFYDYAAII